MAYPFQKPQRDLLPAVLCLDPGSPMPHAVVGGAPSLGDNTVISAFADQGSSSHLIAPRTNPHHSAHFGSHRIGRRKSGTRNWTCFSIIFILKMVKYKWQELCLYQLWERLTYGGRNLRFGTAVPFMEKNEFGYYSFFSYFDRSIIQKEK